MGALEYLLNVNRISSAVESLYMISITFIIDYGYIIQEFCGRARSLHMHWDQLVHFQAPNVICWWFGVQHKVSEYIGSL